MREVRALLLGALLCSLSFAVQAKERVREYALTLPAPTPVSVDVRVPQSELAIEGNDVDADLFGGGLIGWAIASNKNEKRQAATASAASTLQEATRTIDFAQPVRARLEAALANGYFASVGEGRALTGAPAELTAEAADLTNPGRLTLVYRYALTADYRYLRITMVALLPAAGGTGHAYANKFTFFNRLPELPALKSSAERSQVWATLGADKFRGLVDEGMATLADALVYDLKASGTVAGGKKMIYHELAQGVLGEARTETEVDGFDLGRHKDGSLVAMPKSCMQQKCWSIFSTN